MSMLTTPLLRNQALHRQITEHIRFLIVSGAFTSGDQLPSTSALAEVLQASTQTVHVALVALEREGLVVRRHGKGTFVRKRDAKLTCMGIYDSAGSDESLHGRAVHFELKKQLSAAGIAVDVWVDSRDAQRRKQPWEPFVQAAKMRKFQGAIVVGADPWCLEWLRKVPVPMSVYGGMEDMNNCVWYDRDQVADVNLQALAEQGCKSVGIILPANPAVPSYDGSRSGWLDFFDLFLKRCAEFGLTVKDEWVVLSDKSGRSIQSQPEFGYQAFLKLWSHPRKPDGLIVFPDTVAQGMILGLSERRVRVPQELKLVLHKNESVDLVCPMPATFFVSSEKQIASSLIEQVRTQQRGEPCATIDLTYRIVSHAGRG
jgi:DNA-binding LacI/PurR family transcriptional regulator